MTESGKTDQVIGIVRALFHLYARLVVPRAGKILSGSEAGYAYLSRTLRTFYGAEELAKIIAEAGFASVAFRRLSLGVVALHAAVK